MKKKEVFLFLAPSLSLIFLFLIIPLLTGAYYSLTEWNGVTVSEFVGFDNYVRLFSDTGFKDSLKFTFMFTIVSLVLVNIIALSLALLVTRSNGKINTFFRTTFFMPNLIGGIILGFIWQFIFNYAFRAIYEVTGIEFFQGWLADTSSGFWGIVILFVWQMSGYMMVIYISFLNNISSDLLEAADIDGASEWMKLWKIKIPMIIPAITICLFLTLSNAFKLYDQNLALTKGGPYNSTQMATMNIYNEAFQMQNMGYAQAKAIVFLVIILIVSGIQFKFTSSKELDA